MYVIGTMLLCQYMYTIKHSFSLDYYYTLHDNLNMKNCSVTTIIASSNKEVQMNFKARVFFNGLGL